MYVFNFRNNFDLILDDIIYINKYDKIIFKYIVYFIFECM